MKRLLKRIWIWLLKARRAIKGWIVKELDPAVDPDAITMELPNPLIADKSKCYPMDISVNNMEDVTIDVILEVLDKTESGNVNTCITFHCAAGESLLKEVWISPSAYMLDFRKSVFITDTGEVYYVHKRCVPAKNTCVGVVANTDGTIKIQKRKMRC